MLAHNLAVYAWDFWSRGLSMTLQRTARSYARPRNVMRTILGHGHDTEVAHECTTYLANFAHEHFGKFQKNRTLACFSCQKLRIR